MKSSPSLAVLVLTGLSMLACLGPNPEFPESSTCGSTLPKGAPLEAPLPVRTAGALGASCVVAMDQSLHCAWEKAPPAGALAHVSSDNQTVCAIYTDGHLWCDVQVDQYAAPAPFEDAGPWASVAVQQRAACAVRADGELWCSGLEDPPKGAFVDVAVGYAHGCALAADGSVTCWGEDTWCQDDAPPGPYVDLSAAEETTCGARADGGIDCWGGNIEGRPTHTGRAVEVVVTAGNHVCARYDDGVVACEDATWRMPTGRFVALSTNGFLMKNACALRDDGAVMCFGPNDTWPDGATGHVMPAEPRRTDSDTWRPFTEGPFSGELPCEAPLEVSPDGSMRRRTCMREAPSELIGVEVVAPPPDIVASGPLAMLAFAREAKLGAFPDTRLTRTNQLDLEGRPGVAYDIHLPGGRILGRAYVDDGIVYAVTGMYDTTATTWDSYGRIKATLSSARFSAP